MPNMKKVWERDKKSEAIVKAIKYMRDVTSGDKHIKAVDDKRVYLFQFPSETPEDYKTRKLISFFEPFTADAIQSAKGKIFAKEMQIKDLPSQFKEFNIINDFDRNGATIHEFAADLCETQLTEGIVFVYTAFPGTNDQVVVPSIILRPYARMVTGDSIISKKFVTENGKKILLQVVIEEAINEDDGDYQQKSVSQYRKIFIKKTGNDKRIEYQVIRNVDNEEVIKESGIILIAGQKEPKIPLEPCYGIKTGYFEGKSPFQELGGLNVQHYRKSSDYDMSVHRCGAATFVQTGDKIDSNSTKDNATKKATQVGGGEIFALEKGGKAEWISGSDKIKPMEDNILNREDRIKGMSFDVIDNSDKTATAVRDEKSDKEAKLVSVADHLEDCLNATLLHMTEYLNIELGDGKVIVNKDFNLTVMAIEDFKTYMEAVSLGIITMETFFKESQKGERLLTIEKIQDEIDALADGDDGLKEV